MTFSAFYTVDVPLEGATYTVDYDRLCRPRGVAVWLTDNRCLEVPFEELSEKLQERLQDAIDEDFAWREHDDVEVADGFV